MHALLVVASLLIAGSAGFLCLLLLGQARSWDSRRAVQLTGMFVPVIVLGMLATALIHFFSQVCWLVAPPMDVAFTQAFSALGVLAITAAFLINVLRAVLLPVHLRRRTWEAPDWLSRAVTRLSESVGLAKPPRIRVAIDEKPWALAAGLLRPQIVVSSGLLSLLDREELNSVLCHELLHIRRADLWWSALAGALYDLTWFLPATRRLHHKMMIEQEIACDDQLVGDSRRLALAGALARVWQAQTGPAPSPRGSLALLLYVRANRLEARMLRLLERPGVVYVTLNRGAALVSLGMLCLFAGMQLGATVLAMESMGCGLHQLLFHATRH